MQLCQREALSLINLMLDALARSPDYSSTFCLLNDFMINARVSGHITNNEEIRFRKRINVILDGLDEEVRIKRADQK